MGNKRWRANTKHIFEKKFNYGFDLKNTMIDGESLRSNGDLEPTDELMSTDPETVTKTNCNIFNTSLKDFLKHPIFEELRLAQTVFTYTPSVTR